MGKAADGKTPYSHLITFKESEGADPLPRKILNPFQAQLQQQLATPAGNGTITREQGLERTARIGQWRLTISSNTTKDAG